MSIETVTGPIEPGEIGRTTMIFDKVLPRLRDEGVWDDEVEQQVLEANPRAWLAG